MGQKKNGFIKRIAGNERIITDKSVVKWRQNEEKIREKWNKRHRRRKIQVENRTRMENYSKNRKKNDGKDGKIPKKVRRAENEE